MGEQQEACGCLEEAAEPAGSFCEWQRERRNVGKCALPGQRLQCSGLLVSCKAFFVKLNSA